MNDVFADAFDDKDVVVNDDKDQSEIVDEYLEKMLGESTDKKSFKKDFHDKCFDSESTEELESGKIAEYVKYISDKKSIIEKFEKQRDLIDKGFKKISSDIDKLASKALDDKLKNKSKTNEEGTAENKLTHNIGFGADNNPTKDIMPSVVNQSEIARAQRRASAVQSALTSYNSAAMEAGKFAIAQSRRLAAVIVSYKMRHKNEAFSGVEMSDELYTIIGEAAEYEALSAMDDLATV